MSGKALTAGNKHYPAACALPLKNSVSLSIQEWKPRLVANDHLQQSNAFTRRAGRKHLPQGGGAVQNVLRYVFTLGLSFFVLLNTGCDPVQLAVDQAADSEANPPPSSAPTTPEPTDVTQVASDLSPELLIGSFNIQTFGVTKMGKPHVVEILVDIARKFDILAVQELRDGDEKVAKEFLKLLNSDGSKFAAAVGPKQGYFIKGKLSRYFEQAIYFYDTTKVDLIAPTFVATDRYEQAGRPPMHRTPYVGYFRCRNLPPQQAFTFVLMNVHVDPDDAHVEFESLRDIISGVYETYRDEDDFILLGDLNEEPNKYQKYGWMLQQFSAIPSIWKTNTRLTKCYDNIIFDAGFTAEYTGKSGVLNFMQEYGLTKKQALEVSDHLPVWATFSTREASQADVVQDASEGLIR